MNNNDKPLEQITTKIWREEAEPDNPYAAAASYCAGYDVYGDLLGKASLIEYLWLLFKLNPPRKEQARMLESLAVALANPGPRDHSVRGAMNAGVGGSTRASALIAALSIGAGNLGGAREVFTAMQYWQQCGMDLDKWLKIIANPPHEEHTDVWPEMEHTPGFDPNGASCPTPVKQLLDHLIAIEHSAPLVWLQSHRPTLERHTDSPLAFSGVAAATLFALGFDPEQAEILFLMLRLPGAAAHALEQEKMGWSRYPFFGDKLTLTNDPGPSSNDD
ncbi:citryl-CoA lyase [Gammaproteobacteria bacterium 53_120_T64]|nr:citryl-CoA lyase [Gammaproteobacteria bacterium 53_120_T64]